MPKALDDPWDSCFPNAGMLDGISEEILEEILDELKWSDRG